MQGKIWLKSGESFEVALTQEDCTGLKRWVDVGQVRSTTLFDPSTGLEIFLAPDSVQAFAVVRASGDL